MHLNADELVDLAEGAQPESSARHLAACPQCRARLDDLRAMMSAVAGVDVPEPSPLFWDHFSQRVHDAVASEEGDARLKGSRSIVQGVRALVIETLGAPALPAAVVALTAAPLTIDLPCPALSPRPPAPVVPP